MKKNKRTSMTFALSVCLSVGSLIFQSCQSIEEKKQEVAQLQTELNRVNHYRGFIAYPKEVSLQSAVTKLMHLSLELAQYYEERIGLVPNAKTQAQSYYQLAFDLYQGCAGGDKDGKDYSITEIKQYFDTEGWTYRFWTNPSGDQFIFLIAGGISIPITIVAAIHDTLSFKDCKHPADKFPVSTHDLAEAGLKRVKDLAEDDWTALKQTDHAPNLSITLA